MFNVQCAGDEVGTHRGNTRNKWKDPVHLVRNIAGKR